MRLRICVLVIALTTLFSSLSAQSLAELAKKERERRQKETKVPRVIRNEDLKNLGNARVTTTTSPSVQPKAEAVVAGPGPATAETTPPPPPEEEKHWREAFKNARLQLKLTTNRGMVLELRINDLRNRLLTESDASTRSLIDQALNEAATQLEINKGEIIKAQEALQKLEDDARKANVPAGWTREEGLPTPSPVPPTPGTTPPSGSNPPPPNNPIKP
ncbi:MAG TPA: hypothetical protein VGL91_24495 [Acidobacteriota bacterium]|jgi:hypothetical protein